jgi:sugar-specific transcriptional regulator TrmB
MERAFMTQNDECIQTLMDLGLTFLQAKTYLALATLGKADVKNISKASNVVRQDIYRVMRTLEKLGLAEKIIATPVLYEAVPLRKGLSILLQRKAKENAELQKKTRALINNFQEDNIRIALQKEEPQFIITSEGKLFRKRFEKDIQMAQTSIDIVVSSHEVFEEMVFHHLQCFNRAMKKGVKIRALTEKAEDESISRDIQVLKKNRFFKLKYLSAPVPVTMTMFDGEEVNIRISSSLVPSLWSNNPTIVKLAASYFGKVWNETRENGAKDS